MIALICLILFKLIIKFIGLKKSKIADAYSPNLSCGLCALNASAVISNSIPTST